MSATRDSTQITASNQHRSNAQNVGFGARSMPAVNIMEAKDSEVKEEAEEPAQQDSVQPTLQMKQGVPVNDDKGLEEEADIMGAKAMQGKFK